MEKINKKNYNILEDIYKDVQQAAYEIINRKKATYYGIGLALTKLVKAIINDEEQILSISTKLEGEYNHEGLFIGVPAIVNRNGTREILQLRLTEEEQAKFDYSWDTLEKTIKETIDPLLNEN